MKIQSVTLQNFHCFGDIPTTIKLSEDITTLVGANGSGKTAFLDALSRVFGITREQRTIRRTDFHVSPNSTADDRSSRELYIDVRLAFPELVRKSTSAHAVPPCFHHMVVEKPGAPPFCRVRLEAKWTDDGTIDGDIEQNLCWVMADVETPSDEQKQPLAAHDRGLIQTHYVPAARDASTQIAYATSSLMGRLLRAVAWSPAARQAVKDASETFSKVFADEAAIQVINEALVRRWGDLYDAPVDAEPELQIIGKRFEDAIRRLNIIFRPTEEDGEREYDALSDGQKSLFYFSLVAAVFDIERKLLDANSASNVAEMYADLGFRPDLLQIPALTIFALEEPENHLASYFLARIIKQINSVAQSQMAQAVFTSHSPAILGRVPPKKIRHFRLDPDYRTAIVQEISLPDQPDQVAKYVQEAVTAFPEVYFARFVILCEGASEQIVIPRLASALKDLDIDSAFVAVVPLGGRHVNHFWKLLTNLDIPYATLIDLDLGREGGAWGRIKYACEQLIAVGKARDQLLTVCDDDGNESVLSEGQFAQLHIWDANDVETIKAWTDSLEDFGVFFSTPLDLDMAMLSCFPRAYQAIAPTSHGPRIPEMDDPAYQGYLEGTAKTVLGEAGPGLSVYSNSLRDLQPLFPWYRYLFSNKSKPSTHILALSQIDDDQLASSAPPVLVRLLNHVSECLGWEPQTDF